jgi:hypothetical protein
MRRSSFAAISLVALALFASTALRAEPLLPPPPMHVNVPAYSSEISGSGWPWNAVIVVTVSDADGRLKGMGRAISQSVWSAVIDQPIGRAVILPLDVVRIYADGVLTCTLQLAGLQVRGSDRTNLLKGRVTIGSLGSPELISTLSVQLGGERLVNDPAPAYRYATSGALTPTLAADGTFTISGDDFPSAMTLRKTDFVVTQYRQLFTGGSFNVVYYSHLPGLRIFKDTNLAELVGQPGAGYTATLMNRFGAVKARATGAPGTFLFLTRKELPTKIVTGDRIQLRGPGAGFTVPVPRLNAVLDGTTLSGQARPDTVVGVTTSERAGGGTGFSYTGRFGVLSDSTGTFQYTFATITPGRSTAAAFLQDKAGNLTYLSIPATP